MNTKLEANLARLACALAVAVPCAVSAGPIIAVTPTAAELVATGGEVKIYFAGQTASHDSVLNLIDPVGFAGTPFFPNHATPVGTELSLGIHAAGTVLRFRLDNLTAGVSFETGPGTGNPDGLVHVAHAPWTANRTIPVDGIWVGFEDLLGGGDRDYNDNNFVFSNVRSTVASVASVPVPDVLQLMGIGLVGLAAARRRRR